MLIQTKISTAKEKCLGRDCGYFISIVLVQILLLIGQVIKLMQEKYLGTTLYMEVYL